MLFLGHVRACSAFLVSISYRQPFPHHGFLAIMTLSAQFRRIPRRHVAVIPAVWHIIAGHDAGSLVPRAPRLFETAARRSAVNSVNRKAVRRPAILLGAALSLAFSSGASAGRNLWDPVPASDADRNELSLPMPCGGKMVFRRIQTTAKGPLDDVRISVGIQNEDAAEAAIDSRETSYISGSFSSKDGRYYWLGKYEVTQAQYDAVMSGGGKCPDGDMKLTVPAVNISWYDAVEFTRKYNSWLYQNAADRLPKEDGQPGFVRLPTGTEWEYAARGGISGENGRDAPADVSEVAWSSSNANGRLQLVGLRKPDASGLFDMLGNVEEMTLTPFRFSMIGRQHGQASGFELRGGSYLTAGSGLFYGLRTEQPYYDSTGKEFSTKTIGFRVSVGTPAITSDYRLSEVKEEWGRLGDDSNEWDHHGGDKGTVKKIQELEQKLRKQEEILRKNRELTEANRDLKESGGRDKELADLQTELASLRDSLVSVQNDLRSANMARDEQRDSAIVANIKLGAFLCSNISSRSNEINTLLKRIAGVKDICSKNKSMLCTAEQQKGFERQLGDKQAKLMVLVNYYRSTIKDTVYNYDFQAMNNLKDKALLHVKGMNTQDGRPEFVEMYFSHLGAAYKGAGDTDDRWISDCSLVLQK